MPLLILKKAGAGANVGELVEGGLKLTPPGNDGSKPGKFIGEETLLFRELRWRRGRIAAVFDMSRSRAGRVNGPLLPERWVVNHLRRSWASWYCC